MSDQTKLPDIIERQKPDPHSNRSKKRNARRLAAKSLLSRLRSAANLDGENRALLLEARAEITRLRAPVAVDAAAESKLASNERPEGIPNPPSPGWHEAIEEAAKVAEAMRTQPETGAVSRVRINACKDIAQAIRSLLPPGGEGLKK